MFKYSFNPSIESFDILPALDPSLTPKKLVHKTIIKGIFNGKNFELKGGGTGNPHDGILNCKLTSTNGPVPFPMPLLNVIAIFGYPTYSKHVNVFDIFKRSNGYEYERNISFANGGFMHSLHTVRYSEEGDMRILNGIFEVNATDVDAPDDIVGLTPILETFIPAGKGKVRSKFILSWMRKNNTFWFADCESEYRLRHNLELPKVLFRHAEFVEDNSTDEVLNLDEKIWVTSNLKYNNENIQNTA